MNRATRDAEEWLIRLGRFGFIAKGIVYTLIGILAVQTAIGAGGRTTGKAGALEQIGEAPFGRVLLIAMAIGIAGYALWRFIQAALDTENKGTDGKGIAVRVGYSSIGLWIAALAVLALVEKALPAGRWVGRAAGAALISWGIATLLV